MKKSVWRVAAASGILTLMISTTAFAGSWRMDGGRLWYQNDDGSSPKNGWQWIDSDLDGVSECYYFDENGYVLTNTTTPDGYRVNGIGAWVENGAVKTSENSGGSAQTGDGSSGGSSSGSDDFWGGFWDDTYNWDPDWYLKDDTLSEGDKAGYHYYAKYFDYNGINLETSQKVSEQVERIVANPNGETAVKEMAWVEVPVWKLKNGQKVAGTMKVQVLSSIVDEVKEIFTEIYNGPEQFPINSIGGYNWRSNGLRSNHSCGLALDINPDQNPQVTADGVVLVGSKWEPGVNPYSIGMDSDVVKAFGKHGWNWGASFTTKDYMHFDFGW